MREPFHSDDGWLLREAIGTLAVSCCCCIVDAIFVLCTVKQKVPLNCASYCNTVLCIVECGCLFIACFVYLNDRATLFAD